VLGWNGNEQERTFQLVDVSTGAVRTIRGREADAPVEWSPDGRRILFSECQPPRHETAVLALLDIETGSTSIVAKATGKDNCPHYESFAWSPDGRRIGYIRCTPVLVKPEACDVHVMNADGTQSRRLTTTPGLERSLDW
jgi:Tol biopolymer transport system component